MKKYDWLNSFYLEEIKSELLKINELIFEEQKKYDKIQKEKKSLVNDEVLMMTNKEKDNDLAEVNSEFLNEETKVKPR